MKTLKKGIALLLVLAMSLSMMSLSVFADDTLVEEAAAAWSEAGMDAAAIDEAVDAISEDSTDLAEVFDLTGAEEIAVETAVAEADVDQKEKSVLSELIDGIKNAITGLISDIAATFTDTANAKTSIDGLDEETFEFVNDDEQIEAAQTAKAAAEEASDAAKNAAEAAETAAEIAQSAAEIKPENADSLNATASAAQTAAETASAAAAEASVKAEAVELVLSGATADYEQAQDIIDAAAAAAVEAATAATVAAAAADSATTVLAEYEVVNDAVKDAVNYAIETSEIAKIKADIAKDLALVAKNTTGTAEQKAAAIQAAAEAAAEATEAANDAAQAAQVATDAASDAAASIISGKTVINTTRNRLYDTLSAAVTDAGVGDTLVLLENVQIVGNDGITIPAGKQIILDLNGKALCGVVTSSAASQVILNKGNLTIEDSSFEKTGTIFNAIGSDVAVGEWWMNVNKTISTNYATNTIVQYGTLTINGGTIKCNGDGSICFAIDTKAGSTTNINGGAVEDDYGSTVRLALGYNGTGKMTFNMTGGRVGNGVAKTAIWVQLPNGSGNVPGEFNISGGEIIANGGYAFYDTTGGQTFDNVSYNFTGGSFKGKIYSYGSAYGTQTGNFTGGYYTMDVGGFIRNSHYSCIPNPDTQSEYTYMIVPRTKAPKNVNTVAMIGETEYFTLNGALSAAVPGDVVDLIVDVVLEEDDGIILRKDDITLDLNGCTITNDAAYGVTSYGSIKVMNGAVSGSGTAFALEGGALELDGVQITSTSSDAILMYGGTITTTGAPSSITATGNGCDGIFALDEGNLITGTGSLTVIGKNAGIHILGNDSYSYNWNTGLYDVSSYPASCTIDASGLTVSLLSVDENSYYYDLFAEGGAWNGYGHTLPAQKTSAATVVSGGVYGNDPSDYVDSEHETLTLANGWYAVIPKSNKVAAVSPTCDTAGNYAYYAVTKDGVTTYYVEKASGFYVATSKQSDAQRAALGHVWNVSWSWSEATATAAFTCANDAGHTDTRSTTGVLSGNSYTASVTGPDGKTYTATAKADVSSSTTTVITTTETTQEGGDIKETTTTTETVKEVEATGTATETKTETKSEATVNASNETTKVVYEVKTTEKSANSEALLASAEESVIEKTTVTVEAKDAAYTKAVDKSEEDKLSAVETAAENTTNNTITADKVSEEVLEAKIAELTEAYGNRANIIDIKVDLKLDTTLSDYVKEDGAAASITYTVKPKMVTTVKGANSEGEALADIDSQEEDVANDQLSSDEITVKLPVPADFGALGQTVQVKHMSDDGSVEYHDGTIILEDGVYYVEFTVTHFSSFELVPPGKVFVSFNANGGSGSMDAIRRGTAETATASANGFSLVGYSFTGWNTASDGNGTPYAVGDTIPASASNVTLYAQWALNAAPVIIDTGSDDGIVVPVSTGAPVEIKDEETPLSDLPIFYVDVATGDWFRDAVAYVTALDLMNGVGEQRFDPNSSSTRGMVATILMRLANGETTDLESFDDVADSSYYAEAAAWAAQNGVFDGYDDGTFRGEDVITREQLATVLYRYAQYKGYTTDGSVSLDAYADGSKVSGYATEAMKWALANGILKGVSETEIDPRGAATRAQLATIMMRFNEMTNIKA